MTINALSAQYVALDEVKKETTLTLDVDVKLVEASKPASVIATILNRAFLVSTPAPRRRLGPAGRLAKTKSGSSSGYSRRATEWNMSIADAKRAPMCVSGDLRENVPGVILPSAVG